MVAYRRNCIPGASYFFTVILRDRTSSLLVDYVDDLREVIRSVKAERPFAIDAIVIMPEYLHSIWPLPQGECHLVSVAMEFGSLDFGSILCETSETRATLSLSATDSRSKIAMCA